MVLVLKLETAAQIDGPVHRHDGQIRSTMPDDTVGATAGELVVHRQAEIGVDVAVFGAGMNFRARRSGGISTVMPPFTVENLEALLIFPTDAMMEPFTVSPTARAGGAQPDISVHSVGFGVGLQRFGFHLAIHGAADESNALRQADQEVDIHVVADAHSKGYLRQADTRDDGR